MVPFENCPLWQRELVTLQTKRKQSGEGDWIWNDRQLNGDFRMLGRKKGRQLTESPHCRSAKGRGGWDAANNFNYSLCPPRTILGTLTGSHNVKAKTVFIFHWHMLHRQQQRKQARLQCRQLLVLSCTAWKQLFSKHAVDSGNLNGKLKASNCSSLMDRDQRATLNSWDWPCSLVCNCFITDVCSPAFCTSIVKRRR